MDEREPSFLGKERGARAPAETLPPEGAESSRPARASVSDAPSSRPRPASDAPLVTVAGLWRRLGAGAIDAALVLPVALGLAWVAARIAGLSLPPARRTGIDYWLDLSLAGDPALWGTLGLAITIVCLYLLLFQITLSRTIGMRLLGLRVIDVYGEDPGLVRAAVRTAGYLLGALTLGLGFVWIGLDREKRGLHDWLAGTYVIIGEPSARPRQGSV